MADYVEMACLPVMEECVFRFDISEEARTNAPPSCSFSDPSLRERIYESGEVDSAPWYVPSHRLQHGQQTVELRLPEGTHFYGTGMVTGSLERTGKRIATWNTDAWGYTPVTHVLYQSHPWVVALLPDGDVLGVLADTPSKMEVDLRHSSRILFRAEVSYPVLTFGPYSRPEELMQALGRAIGTCAMPPKWALGYQQCRWSYKTADRVLEVARKMRERKLPCDVVWIDIDYMDGKRPFTLNEKSFPDRPALAAAMRGQGFRCLWVVDAGVKVERGYPVFDSGDAQDSWVLAEDGNTFTAPVWPGLSCWPDFSRREVRDWWGGIVADFAAGDNGVAGICADMNEPALFRTMSRTMPSSCIHRGDPELGGTRKHLYYHNLYGGLMGLAAYQGLREAHPDRRPFVLCRAGFMGDQRCCLAWTGDNQSQWDHLDMAIPMTLNLALSGHSFAGADIGGFHGDATPELFARWMGVGALMPLARGHSDETTKDHEPWCFGEECEDVCRLALERRYRLLPHLYTLMYRAHRWGLPPVAPVFFADTKDPRLRKLDTAFLLGPILVSASVVPHRAADKESVVLPEAGIWRQFDFGDQHPDLPLMHLRGGGIVATGPVIQHVGQASDADPVDLWVALDEGGTAEGFLYEDAGDGFAYLEGDFLLTHYTAQLVEVPSGGTAGEVVLTVERSEGQRQRPERVLRVRLVVGDGVYVVAQGMDGEAIRVQVSEQDSGLEKKGLAVAGAGPGAQVLEPRKKPKSKLQ